MACTRKEILRGIREVIENDLYYRIEESDEFIYRIEDLAGTINVLDLLSIFTTARQNLLSELMEKLAIDDISKEEVVEVISGIMMGFNQ